MLQPRPNCECRDKDLADARICSYESTMLFGSTAAANQLLASLVLR
jgi:hypothetical protein